eukprot:NODE_8712_length_686_cov_107.747780_g8454_i0.p1 GENE.NODE_8712_length_686_cov_107.747780_g8454_i0~~NODE_8712_length_686_cov_107.747780_g8454_i0.p1  ORF type:complete len:102 (+),score=12.45 NODE_8712_length_686_cov_107.747780_g8454_i0:164-469(+)
MLQQDRLNLSLFVRFTGVNDDRRTGELSMVMSVAQKIAILVNPEELKNDPFVFRQPSVTSEEFIRLAEESEHYLPKRHKNWTSVETMLASTFPAVAKEHTD